MKPASPYEVRDLTAYEPSERCGQGPYRFESEALHARYGEQLEVYACGKHAISGNYRLTTTRPSRSPDTSEAAFGFRRDNTACKGRDVTAVTAGKAGGSGGPAGRGKAGGAPTTAAPTTIKPVTLTRAAAVPEDCVRSFVLDHGWTTDGATAPIDGHFVIDVWSDEPNDLEGLVFVVERRAVVADMTLERWHAYRAAYEAWYQAYRANLDVEVRAGRTTLLDVAVRTPPPPPPRAEIQPPRPSRNARWIPGYWFYEDTQFHWIVGLWDVPEQDIQRALTVQAPKPPPATPARDEPVEPRPTRTAVWTPGGWYWDGHAYVWIAGAWRIPPDPQHTWQRSTWTIRTGGAVFVPGGWRIRIGR